MLVFVALQSSTGEVSVDSVAQVSVSEVKLGRTNSDAEKATLPLPTNQKIQGSVTIQIVCSLLPSLSTNWQVGGALVRRLSRSIQTSTSHGGNRQSPFLRIRYCDSLQTLRTFHVAHR